jgi:hypothetical protein
MEEGQERILINMVMLGRWRSSISAHLQGSAMNFRFSKRKNCGRSERYT